MATRAKSAKTAKTAPATKAAKKPGPDRAPKTRPQTTPVADFIAALPDPQQRADSATLVAMMRAATGCEAEMWGAGIVGFDRYRQRDGRGREVEWMRVGFSPRKAQLVLYLMPGFDGHQALLARLGKHGTGKSCLYLKRLADVDPDVLEQLVRESVAEMRRRHPG